MIESDIAECKVLVKWITLNYVLVNVSTIFKDASLGKKKCYEQCINRE